MIDWLEDKKIGTRNKVKQDAPEVHPVFCLRAYFYFAKFGIACCKMNSWADLLYRLIMYSSSLELVFLTEVIPNSCPCFVADLHRTPSEDTISSR